MKTQISKSYIRVCKSNYVKRIFANRYLYLLLAPGILYFVLFEYRAMYGLMLAFKDYNARLGIMGSPFVGLKHFKSMFADSYFWYVFMNTLKISFGRIFFTFPAPIIIALGFNEMRGAKFKKTMQTIYTFPHFLSWVIVSGIIINFLDYAGPLNKVLSLLGMERQAFMGSKELFIPILYFTDVWKEAGWSSIIYLAAITSINPEFYEAAELDGANRFQKTCYITLPCIRSTILILLTLKAGTVLNAGFDQIFNLSNPIVQKTSDIIDTYIYRITFQTAGDFSYSTAVSMLKSVINFSLIILLDGISRRIEGVGILARDTKAKGERV